MASTRAGTPPLRVLIVEDHPTNVLLLQVALSNLGQRVVGAAATKAEVECYDPKDIDLAIVDLNLADGLTGLAIATALDRAGVAVALHTTEPWRIPAGFTHLICVLDKPASAGALSKVIQALRATAGKPSRW